MTEFCNITKQKVEELLKCILPNNNLDELKDVVLTWNYESEDDLNCIKKNLTDIIKHIEDNYCNNKIDIKTHVSIHCFVHNTIHEQLMPIIKTINKNEDSIFYEKCRNLCENKIDPRICYTTEFDSLPFTAAVVELSLLDNHASPSEKINCLCTTYDLIFAELKSSLVSLISKYSEKEMEIPIINNEEVIPILQFVLARSKLYYFYSNLFYVRYFAEQFIERDSQIKYILKNFDIASKKLLDISEKKKFIEKQGCCDELRASEIIKTLMNADTVDGCTTSGSIKEEYKRRYLSLICLATDENYIPTKIEDV